MRECLQRGYSGGRTPAGRLVWLGLTLLAAAGCSAEKAGESGSGATGGTGAGGGSATGGSAGASAGRGGSGGGGGSATGGSAGSATAGSGGGSTLFDASLTTSSKIPTVGIVTWSIGAAIESAHIDFGRDQNAFEYQAPVDLDEPSYRTLLLGMKPATTYYARIVAQGGGTTYTSPVYTLMTGYLPNGLPILDVTDHDASRLFAGGGFTINCTGLTMGGFPGGNPGTRTNSYAFVFDKDGDQVWAYELTDTTVAACSRARMSVDGKYMWAGNFNNADSEGYLMRVTMDGMSPEEDFSIRARNHDFAFLPDGKLLYWEQQNGGGYTDGKEGPDTIRVMDPETREVTDVYDQMTDFAEQINDSQGAHTNQANYVPELDAISFSMRHTSTVGLISYPEGELMAVFGGPTTSFSNMDWDFQHGHHVLADRVYIFNNTGSNGGSSILGFDFDLTSNTATSVLDYSSGKSSGAFGDVKQLGNGNLYVTYSTSGVFHEITESGELLREITTSGSFGYSEHRATLYGPPPPFD